MVVNVLVYIEGRKDVKGVAKVDLPWNGCIAFEDREEVGSADHGVYMYNGHDPISVDVMIRFNDPHTIIRVRVVKRFAKLVNECA